MVCKVVIHKINKMYRWYPPRRWVFFPLYRLLRRKAKWSMGVCNIAIWGVSALLHATVVAVFGHFIAAAALGAVFLTLGAISTVIIVLVKRPYTTRSRCGM